MDLLLEACRTTILRMIFQDRGKTLKGGIVHLQGSQRESICLSYFVLTCLALTADFLPFAFLLHVDMVFSQLQTAK